MPILIGMERGWQPSGKGMIFRQGMLAVLGQKYSYGEHLGKNALLKWKLYK